MNNLWKAYRREAVKPAFGSARLQLKTGNRWHTSLAMVEDRSRDVETGRAILQGYSPEKRYVLAKSITRDLLVSIYDVNTSSSLIMRPSMLLTRRNVSAISQKVKKSGFKNIEVRLIGLQNGTTELSAAINDISKAVGGALIEVDLFGNEIRNIAIDLKTGSSYDLLMQNRIYGPAERINNETADEFAKRKSELAFV